MTGLLLVVALMAQPFGDLLYCSHEIVLGQPQSGKTTEAKARVASAWRVVFVTPDPDDYRDVAELVTVDELEADAELLRGATLRLVVPVGDEEDATAELHEEVVRVVQLLRKHAPRYGGCVVVLDEVGDYAARAAGTLTKLHRNGHHRGLASVLISQTAVDIPLTCRRTATRVASLLQTRAEDLAALARDYGEPFAEAARRWRPGEPPAVWTLPTLYER